MLDYFRRRDILMKKLLWILLILLIATPAFAGPEIFFAVKKGAASSCNPTTNEIDSQRDTLYATDYDYVNPMAICYRKTADCSGTLDTAYLYIDEASGTAEVKICVYNGTGTGTPTSANTKIGCSGSIVTGGGIGWKSSPMDGGSTTASASYFVCVFNSSTAGFATRRSGGATPVYSDQSSSYYNSPPANLGSGPATADAGYDINAYITLK
jgi:hypothetical protein